MKRLFWKTYRVEMITEDNGYRNVQFMRGFAWEVVQMATNKAKEKSEKEQKRWAVNTITRI